MADEEDRHVKLAAERAQQLDDLRLNRHVEGARRLVADQQLRLDGEGAGDCGALALSAADLVGIALCKVRRKSAALQQLPGALARICFGQAVVAHALADAVSERAAGIKGLRRRLKDDLHLFPRGTQGLPFQLRDVQSVEHDGAGGRRCEPGDEMHKRGFAAAALADEAEALARQEVERHVPHGADVLPAPELKGFGQSADGQDRFRHLSRLPSPAAARRPSAFWCTPFPDAPAPALQGRTRRLCRPA